MLRLEADRTIAFRDGLRRRNLLHAGSLSALGLSLNGRFGLQARDAVGVKAAGVKQDVNCILLMLVGGPSHLDTWDMKPEAPSGIRGPYKPIRTNVPGIEISEIFPRMAKHADKYSIVRSVHHTAAAVHDTGHQLMQTGRIFQDGMEHPHIGCVLAKLKGPNSGAPPHVLLPGPIGHTGGNMPHGQDAGYLGRGFDPVCMPDKTLDAFELHHEPEAVREKYGVNRFGKNCLRARRLVESGVRFVTVNMFETVFDETTWDIHGAKPFSPISCYRDEVGPMFDMAYSSLLEDLQQRGLLANTMVVAFGEFGRTPKINPAGGRDHWPGCWSILMGGGPLKGGTIVGASDEIGGAPKDRPTTPAEVAASIYKGLGIDWTTELPGHDGRPVPLVDRGVEPIKELF